MKTIKHYLSDDLKTKSEYIIDALIDKADINNDEFKLLNHYVNDTIEAKYYNFDKSPLKEDLVCFAIGTVLTIYPELSVIEYYFENYVNK